MKRAILLCLLYLLTTLSPYAVANSPTEKVVSRTCNGYTMEWDVATDKAKIRTATGNGQVWEGSLLPAFWVKYGSDSPQYYAASTDIEESSFTNDGGFIVLRFPNGVGKLAFKAANAGIVFESLTVEWQNDVPPIVDLFFGTSVLTTKQRSVVALLDKPFWPDWQAEGYSIPTAKSSPVMSFFSAALFGNAEISLGSFGTSATPYAAAYPRPIYAAAMGGKDGWVALGAGDIPDGAMYLDVRATCGALRYAYREDLWGAGTRRRTWTKPLVLQWAATAWDAYAELFSVVGDKAPVASVHQKSHWNSWGDFSKGDYSVRKIADQAKAFGAEELTLDMGWETFESSAIPNLKRIPDFYKDIEYIKNNGLDLGFWQSLLWVTDPEAAKLTKEDLLCGVDGQPRRNNIFHNPYWADWSYFLIDPSSPRARAFLRDRTRNLLRTTGAKLLKLDFAYATPPPDVAAPRDPMYRGERFAYTLIKLIGDAAREVDPDVTIQYYGISPLLKPIYNLVALDDMADASGDEAGGHSQWSVWAALAGMNGYAIMASSGYDWFSDPEVLLNTAVIGSPGTVLKRTLPDGSAVPTYLVAKRKALNKWYRRAVGWTPLWLNSSKGALQREPRLLCWGRLESRGNRALLTSLSLRDPSTKLDGYERISSLQWRGRWAVISQDENDIFESAKLAVIPFDNNSAISIPRSRKPRRVKSVYLSGEAVNEKWKWEKGVLTLSISDLREFDKLLGFLIE